jgi:hypothetical protein
LIRSLASFRVTKAGWAHRRLIVGRTLRAVLTPACGNSFPRATIAGLLLASFLNQPGPQIGELQKTFQFGPAKVDTHW